MFSANEVQYFTGLATNMREQGYKYYVIYENNTSGYRDNYTALFSKDNITANSPYSFTLTENSVSYTIPNYSDGGEMTVKPFSGSVNIGAQYNCLTNAEFQTYSVQPDLPMQEVKYNENFTALALCVVCAFLVALFYSFTR